MGNLEFEQRKQLIKQQAAISQALDLVCLLQHIHAGGECSPEISEAIDHGLKCVVARCKNRGNYDLV